MPATRRTVVALGIVGVVLIIIAIVYFAQPAKSLPGFFPGHEAGSSHHHVKHGIAALVARARGIRARLVPDRAAHASRGREECAIALISYSQAVLLGLLQGFSELFPISSLGHSVILPRLLGWDIHQNDPYFVTFLVATHLATALVLLAFFWRDWVRILRGLGRSLRRREIGEDADARLGWLLVVGTVPAGMLGLLLEHALRDLFASGRSAAFFLSSTA